MDENNVEVEIMKEYVLIVRCRDCKWYDQTHPYGTVVPDAYHCKANDRFYSADHFCAYGERKEDEERT